MKFIDILKDNTVAIVGNASSLLDMNKGREIDSHDIVIRINRPGNLERGDKFREVFGVKMDVWCLWNADTFIKENPEKFHEKYHTQFKDNSICKIEMINRGVIHEGVETIYTQDNGLLESLEERVISLYPPRFGRTGYKFSSGFLLVDYISDSDAKSVSIYGMDFKATPTYYNEDSQKNMRLEFDRRCGHDYYAERRYILEQILTKNKNMRLIS